MRRRGTEWLARHLVVLIAVMVLLAVAVNSLVTIDLAARIDGLPACPEPPRSLPCAAVPIGFVHDAPLCADKLLQAMNVTNVHILPGGSDVPGFDSELGAYVRERFLRCRNGSAERGCRRS